MKINKRNLLILSLGILGGIYLKYKTDSDFRDTFDGAISMVQELNPLASQLIIRVDRYLLSDTETIGRMYLNDEYFCDTLEDTYRGQNLTNIKVYGATAIPNGTYITKLTFSNKWQNYYPELFNVPYFTGIRIHSGSSIQDTEGCILTGKYSNGFWTADKQAIQKLRAIMPKYQLCKCVVRVI